MAAMHQANGHERASYPAYSSHRTSDADARGPDRGWIYLVTKSTHDHQLDQGGFRLCFCLMNKST